MSNLVDDLKTYCQKSTMFLYPMLGLPAYIKPIATYLQFENVTFKTPCLIVLFERNPSHLKYLSEIKRHKNFEYVVTEDTYDYVIFNMKEYELDYLKVINGKYSHLSQSAKVKISGTLNNKLATAAMYPDAHYHLYESELEIFITNKEEGPELLDLPNFDNETLCVPSYIRETLSTVEF